MLPHTNPFHAESRDGVTIVRVRTPCMHDAEVAALLDLLDRRPGGRDEWPVILDLESVDLLSSGAISVLARLTDRERLHLVGLHDAVADTLDMLGILQLLNHHPNEATALAALDWGASNRAPR
ncbi:MAG: STAS domain-containing protein [Planctomycetota bacterium]|jgi:anti-anti-sigma regulatory factor